MPDESALSEKLRTALAEAERLAREALLTDDQGDDGQWYTVDGLALSHHDGGAGLADFDAEFIAANHPAHVLRTVAAHRKILDRHARGHWCVSAGRTGRMWWPNGGCEDVRDLVSIYIPGEAR